MNGMGALTGRRMIENARKRVKFSLKSSRMNERSGPINVDKKSTFLWRTLESVFAPARYCLMLIILVLMVGCIDTRTD